MSCRPLGISTAMREGVALWGVVLIASAVTAAQLPKSWPRCRRKDPNLDYCLQHAIQATLSQLHNGEPSLGIPPLEPLFQATPVPIQRLPGRVSLQLTLSNITLLGISGAKLLAMFSDVDNGILDMYFSTPVLLVDADAEVEGSILHEPVKLNRGKANFTLHEISGFVVLSGRIVQRGGEEFLDVQNSRASVMSLSDFSAYFEKLDGNPRRSAKLNYLLNTNILALWPSFRDTLQLSYAETYRQLANLVFSKVPLKDIFLADNHPAVLKGPTTVLL